jgi:hypothetical protein
MSKRQQETDLPLVRPAQSVLIWGFRGENSERPHVFKSSTIQALNPFPGYLRDRIREMFKIAE